MRYRSLIFLTAFFAILGAAQQDLAANTACQLLNDTLPGLVFFPGSPDYTEDNSHFAASSTQNSSCTVEPSQTDHIGAILEILGREYVRAPFAVKGAGHTSNLGFSSTTGVEISLDRFSHIIPDPLTNTVQLGPSATWDQVYAALDPFNLVVAGSRIPGVGVGGLALGGGYGWLTDEYGLTIDNILSWDLVLPNGTFIQVTDDSHPDLAFALRGGFSNFGIVTSFTMKTHPGNQVWAGTVSFPLNVTDQVFAAIENYSFNHTDDKAGLLLQYSAASARQPTLLAHLCYHAPVESTPAVFSEILAIPSLNNTARLKTMSQFLIQEFGAFLNPRIGFAQHVIPIVHYTQPILRAIQVQVDATVAQAIADGRSIISASIGSEPFIHPFVDPKDSAYPHSTSRQITPANSFIFYSNVSDRAYFSNAIRRFSIEVQKVAIEEGLSRPDDILYSNYALSDTPLELIYAGNIDRLRAIKSTVDPMNVMGLSGGWKI